MNPNQTNSSPDMQPPVMETSQRLPQPQPKQNSIAATLLTFLATAVIFGLGGYFFGDQISFSEKETVVDNNQNKNEGKEDSLSQSESTTSQEDLTKNWKTYTDSKLGFTVKYPDTWFLEYCSRGVIFKPTAKEDSECAPGHPSYEIILQGYDLEAEPDSGLLIDEKEYISYVESDGWGRLTPREDFVKINFEHYKYFFENLRNAPGPERSIQIRVPKENKLITIEVADLKYEPIVDLIVSTIRFQ